MPTSWFKIALGNFFIAALLGLTLRFAFIREIPFFKFKNILHAHSHVAMLGWLYLGLFGLLFVYFVSDTTIRQKSYTRLFWLTQFSVLGMLFSFPFQGYGPVAIGFSTLHIFCTYAFTRMIWGDLRGDVRFSARLLRTSLFFMVLSTFGVWAMGPLMASGFRHSIWYHLAVQFFLHFQFNGWFIIAMLALFFRWIEQQQVVLPLPRLKWFYRLLVSSTVLTFALAVAWAEPHPPVFAANSIGVGLQFAMLGVLYLMLFPWWPQLISKLNRVNYILWQITWISFCIKVLVQTAIALPFVAQMAYTIRNYIIGFIHLMMLGILSFFILGFQYGQSSSLSKNQSWGLIALGSGIIGSETLLFLQGTLFWAGWGFMPGYYLLLFGASALIPIGVGLLLVKSGPKVLA
jgi:branched-subunit amino acid transport protein AzlD